MDVPRHILQKYFTSEKPENRFPLIQHHLSSFDDFLDSAIPVFMKASNPIELVRERQRIQIFLGEGDASATDEAVKKGHRILPPTDRAGRPLTPQTCRLENLTYAAKLEATMTLRFAFRKGTSDKFVEDPAVPPRSLGLVKLGEIPVMLRSNRCYLADRPAEEIDECKYELGGYFIIDGAEKVLLTQELLGNNMFYAGERKRKAPKLSASGAQQGQKLLYDKSTMDDEVGYDELTEFYTGIRTISEDGTNGPYSHFLVVPAETTTKADIDSMEEVQGNMGRDNRLAVITIPGFNQPIPVVSVFRALGLVSDRDIYETVLAGVVDADREEYDDIMRQILLSHENFMAKAFPEQADPNVRGTAFHNPDLMLLERMTRSKSSYEVLQCLHDKLFSHQERTEADGDRAGFFRRKAYLLGHMLRMSLDVALGRQPPSDRDNMRFKRLKTSGVLMAEQFRSIYRDIATSMKERIDRRMNYEEGSYDQKFRDPAADAKTRQNLANMIPQESVLHFFWQPGRMLADFVKGFKGSWDGRVGVAQELARPSYLAAIHHLRKTDLQIDKSMNSAPPRRLYASQFGLMCPVDSPDGSDIGYKKSLALFTRVSTATPVQTVKETILGWKNNEFKINPVANIHPYTWAPTWGKIFINSDLFAVCTMDMDTLYTYLLSKRRGGAFPPSVSIAWSALTNDIHIYCDAGRPIRPVFREGLSPDTVKKASSWEDIQNHLDYIDASETESTLLSMKPFDPVLRSEIHMTFNMSAAANLVPYSDHNPGPRNAFSIAQQKQAASWFATNYQKRFDTIAMMGVCPQKPLSQTWVYNQIMGNGGCLPYGENAMVAVTMYGGHNQEDSVIINRNALQRGMWRTLYYHSFDILEEVLDENSGSRTVITNPLSEEGLEVQEGLDYSKLGEEGIIEVGAEIDEKTVLVGLKTVMYDQEHASKVKSQRDTSAKPKKGQHHARVDAVHTYTVVKQLSFGREPVKLRGVKIRVVEEREPEIGDKMASRHSQKGTIGMLMDEEDLPFTASGLRPDLIFNPHGIPTRMTVGQFLEAASNKIGLNRGCFVDATPFTTTNRTALVRESLLQAGYQSHGHEVMYNGQTGEALDTEVFFGPIYYQRLKHMVQDKVNYRATGPKKLLTHQPTQGRGDGGGLRIGEMERDVLVAYGMSKFTTESFMDRSDRAEFQFDREIGKLATSDETKEMPYAMGLFVQELESMHVSLTLQTQPVTMPDTDPNSREKPPSETEDDS